MIDGNPFLSDSFTSIWAKHFNAGDMGLEVAPFRPLRFVKQGKLPFLINSGGTLTKGVDYELQENIGPELNGKVLLVYDVPTYFESGTKEKHKNLGFYATKQYPGYLIALEEYKDIAHFMSSTFSKSSRYKLNKYKRRLEECFDIDYRMWFGHIPKDEYDSLFKDFRRLLEKRFDDKGTVNNNLDTKEWEFYKEVAYPMILQKKAALFVIYDTGEPISVTLNYFSDTVVFDAITVFDIDYSKFHLGSVTVMKLIEWCIENKYGKLDFSKGFFEYKTRWANKTYDFEYHIYYDTTVLRSKSIAFALKTLFNLKQYLRDKRLNEKLHKLKFKLRNNAATPQNVPQYTFTEMDVNFDPSGLTPIDFKHAEHTNLKPIAFEFLYLNSESMKNLKIYLAKEDHLDYIFLGASKGIGVSISPRTEFIQKQS